MRTAPARNDNTLSEKPTMKQTSFTTAPATPGPNLLSYCESVSAADGRCHAPRRCDHCRDAKPPTTGQPGSACGEFPPEAKSRAANPHAPRWSEAPAEVADPP